MLLPKETQKRLISVHKDLLEQLDDITSIRNALGPSAADDEVKRAINGVVDQLHNARHALAKAIGLVTVMVRP